MFGAPLWVIYNDPWIKQFMKKQWRTSGCTALSWSHDRDLGDMADSQTNGKWWVTCHARQLKCSNLFSAWWVFLTCFLSWRMMLYTPLQVTHCKFSNRDQSFQLPQASEKTHGSRRNSWQRFINRTAELRNHLWKKSHILDHQAPCLSSTLEYTFFQGVCTTFLSHPI